MDLLLATDGHRRKLARIIAVLFAMTGLVGDVAVSVLPRRVHLVVLDLLRPAESIARRLVAILAHGLVVPVRAKRGAPGAPIPKGSGGSAPVFALFDPRRQVGMAEKRGSGSDARVRSFDDVEHFAPAPPAPSPDDPVDATRLCRRLMALRRALDDLPGQAHRLARILAGGRAKFTRVMRPGSSTGAS